MSGHEPCVLLPPVLWKNWLGAKGGMGKADRIQIDVENTVTLSRLGSVTVERDNLEQLDQPGH